MRQLSSRRCASSRLLEGRCCGCQRPPGLTEREEGKNISNGLSADLAKMSPKVCKKKKCPAYQHFIWLTSSGDKNMAARR